MTKPKVTIYTDGSCLGNPGPGGWAALLISHARGKRVEKEISGRKSDTTNNQMELLAAIKGLNALTKGCTVELYTDSNYVIKGMTEWMDGWVARGWKNASKKPVANKNYWIKLTEAARPHIIKWHWVKGHSGQPENERVDELARKKAEG